VSVEIWKSLNTKDVRKGVLGANPRWAWYFTKTLSSLQRRLIVFTYILLVNLSTSRKHHEINLYAHFKEHCKWAKRFRGNLGLRLGPETISPLFADLSSTTQVYDCVLGQFTLSETIVFILSAKADQRKRW